VIKESVATRALRNGLAAVLLTGCVNLDALSAAYDAGASPDSPHPADGGPTPGGYDPVVLADKPVALWDLRAASNMEPDVTGNGHTGTYQGGQPTTAVMPNGDAVAVVNGSSEYLSVPTSSVFSIPTTGQLTWEGWIRPDTLQFPNGASYGYVDWMGKCIMYAPTCEWEARFYDTTNMLNRPNALSADVLNTTPMATSGADWEPQANLLQAGQWLYVVGEYQTVTTPSGCNSAYPGSINIWVNGVEWSQPDHAPRGCMSESTVQPTASTSPVTIGTMATDTFFKGAIGKVAIYDKLLTQTQINTHFQAMTGAVPSGSCAATCTIPVPTP